MSENTAKSTENLFANVLASKASEAAGAAATAPATAPTAPAIPDEQPAPQSPTELDMLKQRARVMGIPFSNNIGLEALRAKVNAKLDAESDDSQANEDPNVANDVGVANQEKQADASTSDVDKDAEIAALQAKLAALTNAPVASAPAKVVTAPAASAKLTPRQAANARRQELYNEQMKLVRLRIQNLNPNKANLPGEIFVVANRVLGAVKKYIPYGEQTDNGYHVPNWVYEQLKEREFQSIKVTKDSRGREKVETRMVREFALEVLPPLTERELAQLAAAQAAAGGLD